MGVDVMVLSGCGSAVDHDDDDDLLAGFEKMAE